MVRAKNKQNNKLQKKRLRIYKNTIDINIDINNLIKKEITNISNKEQKYIIPIFIPHKGCKNSCVFCNQRKISGELKDITPDEVRKIIEIELSYLKNNKKNQNIEIAFFGGSFTGLSIKEQTQFLEVAKCYIDKKIVRSIRLSTRPDYINFKILNNLKKYGVKTIELGVQSMDNKILKVSKRGHTSKDVIRASRMIRLYGFYLGHQIMVGLPQSTVDTEIYTAKRILKLNPTCLRIYPVYVIPKSELYDMYKKGIYTPLTIDEAVDRCSKIVKLCQNKNVKIIRLGLQSTLDITSTSSEIFGPVCDNFAEYVFAKLIREELEELLVKEKYLIKISMLNLKYKKINLNLIVDEKYRSFVIGPSKVNRKYFFEKYRICIKLKEK